MAAAETPSEPQAVFALVTPHGIDIRRHHAEPVVCRCPVPERQPVPETGALVIDARLDKVGQVMGHEGPRLQLRPPRGGREWEAAPEDVRPVTHAESAGRWGS
ncbi:hypothetical protein [Streptomyces griseocarneus]|uniref:hypothetical protein n=1 Tax=Streptomyces griseocarneus TaxID=51201 RepID=UPI001CCFD87F|nr:hypothetical protein [Streptomyces griseocarneus]MBZ6475624.1 hypothetical protein [Streptomyces griseocarneus]